MNKKVNYNDPTMEKVKNMGTLPPSPEMVCPNCKGTGYKTKTNGDFTPGFRCANCHGTGKVPSPEHPEKVREEIAELEKAIQELLGIVNESEGIIGWHLNGDILKWEQCESIQVISEKIPILLKLQQAGWGNVAEARQQAQGELSGWIRCPHCGSGAIIWGKDRILLECTNCGNKLQELPKE